MSSHHLILAVPPDWSNDAKGDFFEEFVLEILRPMRLRAERRLRVTGMEIDILAKGEDQPLTVLVECKAYRDPVPAEAITKLMGNVHLRRADQGWLFSTSDLTKDGRGLWEEIQQDDQHARSLVWYSPSRTIDVLVAQRSIVDPTTLVHHLTGFDVGDWTLVATPSRRAWLAELLEDGIPSKYCAFDARKGNPLESRLADEVAATSPRYSGLSRVDVQQTGARSRQPHPSARNSVARVIPGDTWDDPRPARPVDFVGRDDVLVDITAFLGEINSATTQTRSFAVLAPSGWGKSSLALKLVRRAGTGRLSGCTVTAVDSRSATSPAFVAEALRLALRDAGAISQSRKSPLRIQSLREPLASPDIVRALERLQSDGKLCVLLFDQFEELFAKESLFEVFHAVRDLTLDIDAKQVPLVLGFAWKTDVSLPQEHPAYHLWHQLSDRRRTFKVGEFGRGEIAKVVSKAERALAKRLSPALRSRLAEQCQGLPWLLKKLLVHVLQRVSTPESQYLLLERELDIEQLFKQDLEQLKDEHLRCLKFVATRAPIAVSEVEEKFSRDTTNLLIHQRLLVRSGMNYVVYWDIFRDYLAEGKVPVIPWARTFQRMPPVALRALSILDENGQLSASSLGMHLGLKEGPTWNLLGDLVSMQLVESAAPGVYTVARYVSDLNAENIATTVRNQLRRHVVAQAIERSWAKGAVVDYDSWLAFFRIQQPRSQAFSDATLRQYAGNLKSWLTFAGLLELHPRGVIRADGNGAQMGVASASKSVGGLFLGTAAPAGLEDVLSRVFADNGGLTRTQLESIGLRNAVADAIALGLLDASKGTLFLRPQVESAAELVDFGRTMVARQPAVRLAVECLKDSSNDRTAAAQKLGIALDAAWKPASATRYLGGLLRFAAWAGLSSADM